MTHAELALDDRSFAKPTPRLFGEQTTGSVLRNLAFVLRSHPGILFGTVLATLAVCASPAALLFALRTQMADDGMRDLLAFLAVLVLEFGLLLIPAMLTVVVSDLCVGNVPTLRRAFSRSLGDGRWLRLIGAGLLLTFGMIIGFMLLFVPGLWFFSRSMFTATVIILENRGPVDAIRRSFALTKGDAVRLGGITMITSLLGAIGVWLVAFPVLVALMIFTSPQTFEVAYPALAIVLSLMVLPVGCLSLIQLYYDERVRRESYDARGLVEDLMR